MVEPPAGAEPRDPVLVGVSVVEVVDGDTLVVDVDGTSERLRLIGINAPEDGECFSEEATSELARLVGDGAPLRLLADESDRDQYGRLLRYVYMEDLLVNLWLVGRGFARSASYPPDTSQQAVLDDAERSAREIGAGLWADDACGGGAPDTWGVAIVAAVADPDGADEQVPNEETVTIRNLGPDPVDLSGWTLKDTTASHRFVFPEGFTLESGAQVVVHTGCGEATATDLFWCNQGSMVWNNGGDTAYLEDAAGNTVSVLEV